MKSSHQIVDCCTKTGSQNLCLDHGGWFECGDFCWAAPGSPALRIILQGDEEAMDRRSWRTNDLGWKGQLTHVWVRWGRRIFIQFLGCEALGREQVLCSEALMLSFSFRCLGHHPTFLMSSSSPLDASLSEGTWNLLLGYKWSDLELGHQGGVLLNPHAVKWLNLQGCKCSPCYLHDWDICDKSLNWQQVV